MGEPVVNQSIEERPEDIVITGISGLFPESKNIQELENHLKNKKHLVTETNQWSSFKIGKIPNANKFDAAYFGIPPNYAESMDPMGRLLLEKSFEAMYDAGYNPESLRGKKIAVIVGVYLSESEIAYFSGGSSEGMGLTAIARSFLPNRISYCLGLHGPSLCVDTACSSSMHALHLAFQAIQTGACESAIVGGSNLCLNTSITTQLLRLGVLSPNGQARVLDEKSNGYCRAETVCSIFLQKRKDARRIYAQVVHTKINCDGYKPEGITYPSFVMQKRLLKEFYEECDILPSQVDWIELHASGTRISRIDVKAVSSDTEKVMVIESKAGDREEIKAVEIFCENRASALRVGSVKSNMGHAEAASSMCSIAKVIIAIRSGFIPANINYETPRNEIDALHNGLVEVITKHTPWSGGMVGLNGFGLGGANGHALLKSFDKTKVNNGLPKDDLPRIVAVSGRTEESTNAFLTEILQTAIDVEYLRLLYAIHSSDIVHHLYRGYTILNKDLTKSPVKEIQNCPVKDRPIWFVFSGMGCQWPGMGKSLMQIPVFAHAIEECHQALKIKNIDVIRIITEENPLVFENVLHTFVGLTAMQIGMIDILKSINIRPSGIIGHSAGEVACAYADDCFTKQQTILCAYYRGLACLETNKVKASMASVGLPYEELKKRLPHDVDIACWNNQNNCTISGPTDTIEQLVKEFEADKIFARSVNTANMAFHSRYVKDAGPVLYKYLKKVIPKSKVRSEKWISTSVPKESWTSDDARYCSARYQVNNLLNTVLFEQAIKIIPDRSIVVEVSPHSLMNAILSRSLKDGTIYIPLATRQSSDGIEYFLKALGKLYLSGITMELQNLYPLVQFPVSKETQMLAPQVRWQHDRNWNVVYANPEEVVPGERRVTIYTQSKEHSYIFDHVIDGKNIFPGFTYVFILWETVPLMYGRMRSDTSIVFEKLRFERIVNVSRDKNIHLLIHIQKGSGNFEITESGQIVVTGRVYIPDDVDSEMISIPETTQLSDDETVILNTDDIYKEFSLRGYNYRNLFRQLTSINREGTSALVKWNENWVTFLDTIAQTFIYQQDSRNPTLLTSIEKLVINVKKHYEILSTLNEDKVIPVNLYKDLGLTNAAGVQMKGIAGHTVNRRKLLTEPNLFAYKFTPFVNLQGNTRLLEVACFCAYILSGNILSTNMKVVEYSVEHNKEFLAPNICSCLNNYPNIQAAATIVTNKTLPEDLVGIPYLTFQTNQRMIEYKAHLIIIDNIQDQQVVQNSLQMLEDGGFVIIRLKVNETPSFINFIRCSEILMEDEKFTFLRHIANTTLKSTVCIEVTQTFIWVKQLQEEINSGKEIILYAEKNPVNGILGFYNCIRKEIPNHKIRCFFITDKTAPPFSLDNPFYKKQLDLDLLVNVYQNGKWGCYVHYPLNDIPLVKTPHAFVNVDIGDLRTLNWYQGSLNPMTKKDTPESKLIHVYYSALNFKDILLATGALSNERFVRNRIMQQYVIGCEFSGQDNNSKRYMGIYPAGAISTVLLTSKLFLWEIPNDWSLEDAATVPVVYLTVITAFFVYGNLKKGESILIHSGAGGVGQAAINIATHYGCTIFTTVGSLEKREFIKNAFPHIRDSHIGNSRDTTFEQLVMRETKGEGVNLVLNSLAENKLQASVRCLAQGGRFLEIGKLDLMKDNKLGMQVFLRGISFHCILLDNIHEEKEDKRNEIFSRFQYELDAGAVKPIVRKVFENDQVEQAFRYMAAGKHIGKVLIKVREEETKLNSPHKIILKEAIPRFVGRCEQVHIICGGLGGMGLELADWLVLRGAKKLIVTSRKGITTGYQAMRINLWKTYGVTVIVSTTDLSTSNEVQKLLTEAENMGPVTSIFNLAGITEDKFFEELDTSNFQSVSIPKVSITSQLDYFSSKICLKLQYFVVFSSIASGYGNPSQTNYGFANAFCERICEERRKHGLPALAIQWGAVGDVGMAIKVTNLEKLFRVKEQPIRSCLKLMDIFLNQQEPIVTCFVSSDSKFDVVKSESLVQTVANILGISDLKSISMYSPLPQLGMDSISGLEIKQTLEQQHDIFLNPKEMISLTFAGLEEMEKSRRKAHATVEHNNVMAFIPCIRNKLLQKSKLLDLSNSEIVVQLPSAVEDDEKIDTVFFFPSIDGIGESMKLLAQHIRMKVICFQYINNNPTDSLEVLAKEFALYIKQHTQLLSSFNIVAYCSGVVVALETIKLLCSENRSGFVVLIDGSIEFAKFFNNIPFGNTPELNNIQNKIITDVTRTFYPSMMVKELEQELKELVNWEMKINLFMTKIPEHSSLKKSNLKIVANYLYNRYKLLHHYEFRLNEKLNVQASVIRAKKNVLPIPNDLGLQHYFRHSPQEYFVDGTHFSILESMKTVNIINKTFGK